MRPVTRGPAPRVYTAYKQAFNDLVARMGRYCSYCERELPASLAVEHVVPKSLDPAKETDWDNFLLGCTNCNSVKLAQPTTMRDFLWPDRDNTLRAYDYSQGGFVTVASGLTATMSRKADKLMTLVGLDRHQDASYPRPASGDQRWLQREEAWTLAEECQSDLTDTLANAPASEAIVRGLIVKIAINKGFFSVWMTVFAGDAVMRADLVQAFTGTAADCFDAQMAAVKRPGGRV